MAHLDLVAPTQTAPHQTGGLLSIDHVAVPTSWRASAERISALTPGGRLSDHDVYVVEAVR